MVTLEVVVYGFEIPNLHNSTLSLRGCLICELQVINLEELKTDRCEKVMVNINFIV